MKRDLFCLHSRSTEKISEMALWGNWPLFQYYSEAKKGILQQIGEGLLLMMGLVVSSNIDFDDHLPGFRAPSLFLFAQQNSREKEGGQGVGTPNKLDSATL